jgi:hypothetical protein
MVFPASATPEAKARTRAFARVIGPFLVIVPGIIVVRAPEMDTLVSAFFENGALVWIVGGLLLFGGLLIIAHHQYWSSAAAILISLFGWFLALRGLALLIAPQLYQRAAVGALGSLPLVRIGGALVLIVSGLPSWAGSPNHQFKTHYHAATGRRVLR